ncbi:Zn-ribbon domain-containing OB-fold protein [Nocardia jinanensis]|uniref:DNA-binding protein n=1 Tax=Nocardia jinanensis TaxID=382504 RepID=A0A917RMR2_9NOCA|nr:Zn-ribbon domain-containing OB-fold protein [Nocardia jinanensis]GGL15022.1 DNA-binding protein [Nocardia jinanensis]
MTTTRYDLPTPDETTDAYWAAAHEGRLLIKSCRDCGRTHAYPRPFCPHCWSDAVEWVPASGRATLYTFSIVRQNDLPPFRDRLPYIAAVVDLDEGPRMMTDIVDCPVADVYIGMELEFTVRQAEDVAVPVFRPVSGRAG